MIRIRSLDVFNKGAVGEKCLLMRGLLNEYIKRIIADRFGGVAKG